MDRLWTRREFGKLGATLALVPVPSWSQAEPRLGLVRVTRGAAFLRAPVSVPAGEVWRYGIIYPFQVAPRLAAVFCNIRKALNPGVDFELGSDVLLFDGLDAIQRDTAVQISRNHEEPNPNSRPPNEQAVMVKYPVAGAFVPAGAKRADGSPHPHAGTGFGLSTAQAWPQHDRDLGHNADRIGRRAYPGPQAHEYLELQQLSYDGTRFRAEKAEALVEGRASVGDWFLAGNPIRNGIADGDDLLLPYSCRRGEPAGPERSLVASGVLRFRRTAGLWQPHTFVPVTPEDGSWEPTLVRDVDGALLLCARGKGEPNRTSIRVWRSADGGTTWRLQIETLGVISMSPVSINQAADGTPYVAANLFEVPLWPIGDERYNHSGYKATGDGGRRRLGGWLRERLVLWPLSPDRTRLEQPMVARDSRTEFGPPPGGSSWHVDHPSAMNLQLGDGCWHHILGYRVLERAEATHAIAPAPQSGAYLEEVLSSGPPLPAWRF